MKPKISICIITYNQEQYITSALNSAISQVTDFPFEIVVSDDCSTDSTPEICRDYEKSNPGLVRFVQPPQNLGTGRHWVYALKQCRGDYIAMCEGDDFFLSADKLQRQCDCLERKQNYSFCSHEVYLNHMFAPRNTKSAIGILRDNYVIGGLRDFIVAFSAMVWNRDKFWQMRRLYRGSPRVIDGDFESVLNSQLNAPFVHTVSIFGRSGVLQSFPEEFLLEAGFHKSVIVWLSAHGRHCHFPDVMASRVIQPSSSAITKREAKISYEQRLGDKFTPAKFLVMLEKYLDDDKRKMLSRYR